MTSGVKDQVEFRVLVNGEPLPASTNVWNSIKIVERAIDYGLPFAELSLRDSRAATHETNQVAEGTLITITAKRIDGDREREMNFRVIGPISSNRQGAGDHTNVWMCVLDHPRYYSQVHHFAARATSADMIGQVAAHCGLAYKCDQTTDSQIWRNLSRKNMGFAKKICAHGYINEQSVMAMAVTAEDKTLHYRNLPVLFSQKPVCRFILGNVQPKRDLPNYICEQDRGCNTSGITNADFNYGYNSFIPQFSGTSNVKKVQAKKVGATHLYMSRNVKGDVGEARVRYFPFIDDEDVHKNYYKAVYQNARNLALYSQFIAVLVPVQTVAQLFDLVELEESVNQADTRLTQRSGKYIVVAKGRLLAGSHYCEMLLLVRNTIRQTTARPAQI